MTDLDDDTVAIPQWATSQPLITLACTAQYAMAAAEFEDAQHALALIADIAAVTTDEHLGDLRVPKTLLTDIVQTILAMAGHIAAGNWRAFYCPAGTAHDHQQEVRRLAEKFREIAAELVFFRDGRLPGTFGDVPS